VNEIEIRVTGRDDTAAPTRQAERRLQGLRRVAVGVGAGLAAAGAAAGGLFAKGVADNMNIEKANDKLAGQLGLTEKESEKAGKAAGQVYADNWGASIEEVNGAIRAVGTNIKDVGSMTQEELKGMTEMALAYSSTMDKDVNLATEAVGSMLKNGLAKNATEAFDILTAGSQNGVDKADDLLETFQEYSPQFKKLGFDGKYALDLLSVGLKAGARDTDVIADAFKEFSLRSIDGSKLTAEGFKAIGLNAKDMAKQIAAGGPSAQKATQQTMEALLKMKDPIKQNTAGVALFGTQWEDTLRQILPAMVNADGAIEGVTGATKRMADEVGDNAAGKVETLKRKFEQWTQKMASSQSQAGLAATALVTFGGGALQAASQLSVLAIALKGLGASMLMNPVGIMIAALVALGIGLVALWKKSEKARIVMSTAFSLMADVVLMNAKIILTAVEAVANGYLKMVSIVLNAVAKIPGPTQNAAKKAAAAFDDFREDVKGSFDKVQGKLGEYQNTVRNLPKKIRLQADEKDLQAKLRHAQESLKKLPASKRTVIKAEVAQTIARLNMVRAKLMALRNKSVTVTTFYNEIQRDAARASNGARATGGIAGSAATGGIRRGLTLVGEHGRELVDMAPGSRVYPNGATEAMLGAGGGGRGGTVVLELKSGGSRLDDLLVEILRRSIRARGGDVQLVLGRG
jgi:hypothetical protein